MSGSCESTCLTCAGLNVDCGSWGDNCGNTLDCGTCPSGQDCVSGSCVCTPSCSGLCGKSDGCGGICTIGSGCCIGGGIYCSSDGDCCSGYCDSWCKTPPPACDYSPACTQTTSENTNANCGATRPSTTACGGGCVDESWSGGINCGANEECVSGSCVCVESWQCSTQRDCQRYYFSRTDCTSGYETDNDCTARCDSGQCSGGSCVACIPLTCDDLNADCGDWNDGCGKTLPSCGTCPSGYDCVSGKCVTSTPEICSDGKDNDGDGNTDCADWDCLGKTGPNGKTCCRTASDGCPAATGGTNEYIQDTCNGYSCNFNNECISTSLDDACSTPRYLSEYGATGDYLVTNTNCRFSTVDCGVGKCSGDKCVGAENTNALCSDGINNDADNDVDCADSDCTGKTGPNGNICCQSSSQCKSTDSDGGLVRSIAGTCQEFVCSSKNECQKTDSFTDYCRRKKLTTITPPTYSWVQVAECSRNDILTCQQREYNPYPITQNLCESTELYPVSCKNGEVVECVGNDLNTDDANSNNDMSSVCIAEFGDTKPQCVLAGSNQYTCRAPEACNENPDCPTNQCCTADNTLPIYFQKVPGECVDLGNLRIPLQQSYLCTS